MNLFHHILGYGHVIHPLFEALGIFAGYRFYRYLRRQRVDHVASRDRFWMIVAAAFGSVVVSRAAGWLEAVFPLEPAIAACQSGKTIIGGFFGGILAVEATKKVLGLKLRTGDIYVYPIILGLIIGRIGCFFGGDADCTYGIATDMLLGIDFGDGIHRHPAQLYEIAFLLCLGFSLWRLKAVTLTPGMRFKILMISYFLFRLVADAFKPLPVLSAVGLTATQILSLGGLSWYAIDLPRSLRTPRSPAWEPA